MRRDSSKAQWVACTMWQHVETKWHHLCCPHLPKMRMTLRWEEIEKYHPFGHKSINLYKSLVFSYLKICEDLWRSCWLVRRDVRSRPQSCRASVRRHCLRVICTWTSWTSWKHENMKRYRNFVALEFTVAAVLYSLASQNHPQHSLQESDPEQADLVTLWLSSWYLFFLFAWASQSAQVLLREAPKQAVRDRLTTAKARIMDHSSGELW